MSVNYTNVDFRYWTPQDHIALKQAGSSLRDLRDIAVSVASRIPGGIHMVSGPMTSGGLGDLQRNFEVFRGAIAHVMLNEDHLVFSQMPFEDGMVQYHTWWNNTYGKHNYCWPILLEFYEPLFMAAKFDTMHFIYGFESSVGATWEHDQCKKRGIKIRYLSRAFSLDLVRVCRSNRLGSRLALAQ